MNKSTLACMVTFIISFQVVLAQDAKPAAEVIRLKAVEVQASRGGNPFINDEDCEVTNAVGKALVYDTNSCLRFENSTDYSISIYRNKDIYAIIPPKSSIDVQPIISSKSNILYAIASFIEGSAKEWGPYTHHTQSCLMIIFE